MSAQSQLARLGLRLGTLGSALSLAIAAPLAEGDLSQAAHTDASRMGLYFDRTPSAEFIGFVVDGFEAFRVGVGEVESFVKILTPPSIVDEAGFNLAPGVAPTLPEDGDIWITTAGLYARINGATVGPVLGGSGTANQVAVFSATGQLESYSSTTVTTSSGARLFSHNAGTSTSGGNWSAASITATAGATLTNGADGLSVRLNIGRTTGSANEVMGIGGEFIVDIAPLTAISADQVFIGGRGISETSPSGANPPRYAGAILVGLEGYSDNDNDSTSGNSCTELNALRARTRINQGGVGANVAIPTVASFRAISNVTVEDAGATLTIANWYGILLETPSTPGAGNVVITNRWGVYQDDMLATNYFRGLVRYRVVSVSTSSNITSSRTIFTGSTAGQTLTLPAGVEGAEYYIRNTANTPVRIGVTGGDTIEGDTFFDLNPDEAIMVLFSPASDWTIF